MIDAPDALLDHVQFDDDGLVAAIVQDDETDEVLMMAFMNENTLALTLKTGRMTYWSRSREEVWVKGATSGNTQAVRSVRLDCDGDALLFRVTQKGGACHTGHHSCFFRRASNDGWQEDGEMAFDPDEAYG
ncbi:phosphoribosyl-AMP cyclohydrolase [Longibacter sp.]|uniref:phosphoribosyl-AMP cyclohydrolase n=1 Tax=Longibacter sp. TaxID=2045415 RepID=UPI003EB6B779